MNCVPNVYNVKCDSVNEARYKLFCLNYEQSMPSSGKLPSSTSPERFIKVPSGKKTDRSKIDASSPTEHGWLLEENQKNQLKINWCNGPTAPANILQFVYCGCRKSKCTDNHCSRYHSRLKCTDLCHCADCTNTAKPHIKEKEDEES